MKITIMGGAGCVGSRAAFRLAQDGFGSEIVLVDTCHNLAERCRLKVGRSCGEKTK